MGVTLLATVCGLILMVSVCRMDDIRQPRRFSGKVYTVWACGSEGERLTGSQKVVGSSPTRSTYVYLQKFAGHLQSLFAGDPSKHGALTNRHEYRR